CHVPSPHWKLPKKPQPVEIIKETPRTPMSHQEAMGEKKGKDSYMKASVFPSTSRGKASSRKPFGVLSPNVLSGMRGKSPEESSVDAQTKKKAPSAAIHQDEEGEGPLECLALVKPGNTKEKITFFAAHRGRNRIGSMKIKGSWDMDGRATKRGRRGDLKEARIQLERMREARAGATSLSLLRVALSIVHYESDSGAGVCARRPLSVTQMVAFLEQRAGAALRASCANSPASRAVPPASESFFAPGACEEPTERGNPEVGESQREPVRVLDMVTRLESQRLKRQSQPEPGSLPQKSSFPGKRVLLAHGTQAWKHLTLGSVPVGCGPSRAEHCSQKEKQSWDGAAPGCPSMPAGMSSPMGNAEIEPDQQTAVKKTAIAQAIKSPTGAVECMRRELGPQDPKQKRKESVCIGLTVSKVQKGQPSRVKPCEDPLPGRLFFYLLPGQHHPDCSWLNESTAQVSAEASRLMVLLGNGAPVEKSVAANSYVPMPVSPVGSIVPVHQASSWKKQGSHDFLETRFKTQQLLEPKPYMAFLPHHVLVKIFRFLPTKSLVALNCACCYFKFLIEYYNIRPADSRWVRDPCYREDPCKQCKKKYVKGDVSLCRWHPKPYCQALPYRPGYWRCCRCSEKDFPGYKLGLHDNHWVPVRQGFHQAIHKEAGGTETEEGY
uniref:F-box domain-containing protein n=1 Tax=Myotis lucifugus TaxID=59463 RepID=G1Q5G0_MYOLU